MTRASSGHYKVRVTAEKAEELREEGWDVDSFPAFVVMSCSPSDVHAHRRALKDLKRIGCVI